MKSFVSFKVIVTMTAALLCAPFFSCSSGDSSGAEIAAGSGQVVFAVSADMARQVRAGALGVSGALDPSVSESDDFKMEIKLTGGVERSQTVAVKEGAMVVFSDIPLGTSAKASGAVYQKLDESKQKLLYEGETENFVVLAYTPINLDLKGVYYISFYLAGGTWKTQTPPDGRYKKGSPIELPTSNDLARDGYVFAGWFTSDDGGTTLQKFTFTNETKGDIALYAKWVESAVQGISVTVDRDASDMTLSWEAVEVMNPEMGLMSGVKFTANPPSPLPATIPSEIEGVATVISYSYEWRVDGMVQGDIGGTSDPTYTFYKTSRKKGWYDVEVVVTIEAKLPDYPSIVGQAELSAFAQVQVE